MYEGKGKRCIGKIINARKKRRTPCFPDTSDQGGRVLRLHYSESKTIEDDIVLEIPVLRSPELKNTVLQ